jgi:hypothetical protein
MDQSPRASAAWISGLPQIDSAALFSVIVAASSGEPLCIVAYRVLPMHVSARPFGYTAFNDRCLRPVAAW